MPWSARTGSVTVGKDILELLSSSMYVDPMTIYREYVQNAADSIDDARGNGLLVPATLGRVDITLDPSARMVRIRDNGSGIDEATFYNRLTSFGASLKRGTSARGFRGVGRLAGIGYCQELVFRSRAAGARRVNELRWDCRKIKTILRDAAFHGDLADLVSQTVETRLVDATGWPDHFFEVELRNVIRHRNDQLLNPTAVEEYLSQVAPVPFCPSFRYGEQIVAFLKQHVAPPNLEITISGGPTAVRRPHRDRFEISDGVEDQFNELQVLEIPAVDGKIAAIGWVLHHGYKGAIPPKTMVRGLRVRSGNIQVGGHDLLQELFPEPRFNSWSVGEIYVVDSRIVPNGRRDHYEQSVHFDNVLNQLSPIAREIASRCRNSSLIRNWVREFERSEQSAKDKLGIIKQGTIGVGHQSEAAEDVKHILVKMERIAGRELIASEIRKSQRAAIGRIRRNLDKLSFHLPKAKVLARMSPKERRLLERVFNLVYECSANQNAAKMLVDRMLREMRGTS
jgi:molecular chaperone HtpG